MYCGCVGAPNNFRCILCVQWQIEVYSILGGTGQQFPVEVWPDHEVYDKVRSVRLFNPKLACNVAHKTFFNILICLCVVNSKNRHANCTCDGLESPQREWPTQCFGFQIQKGMLMDSIEKGLPYQAATCVTSNNISQTFLHWCKASCCNHLAVFTQLN